MRRLALAMLALLLAAPAIAADHLGPANVTGDETAFLSAAFASDVAVLAVVRPPYTAEYGVGTRLRNGDYRIFVLSGDAQSWPRLVKSKSTDASQYCEAPIPAALGQRVDAVWDAMLRTVAPDADPDTGFDRAHYQFARRIDGQLAVGAAWDRDSDSRVGMLQAIAAAMNQFCHSPGDFERERLVSRVDALAAQLQKPPEDTP